MPPKIRITKEEIIAAAVDLVRQGGEGYLNARAIAKALHCSTQPIFSNFAAIETLRGAVVDEANACYQRYVQTAITSGEYPPYKAAGMAYIRFAQEEKQLFRLLFMRDRTAETITRDTGETEMILAMLREQLGLSQEEAQLFHLEMWAYVHGIAAMSATDYLTLDRALVSRMLTDVYQGLLRSGREGRA